MAREYVFVQILTCERDAVTCHKIQGRQRRDSRKHQHSRILCFVTDVGFPKKSFNSKSNIFLLQQVNRFFPISAQPYMYVQMYAHVHVHVHVPTIRALAWLNVRVGTFRNHSGFKSEMTHVENILWLRIFSQFRFLCYENLQRCLHVVYMCWFIRLCGLVRCVGVVCWCH